LLAALFAAAVIAVAVKPAMGLEVWPLREWTFAFGGGFQPKALPKREPTPVSFFLSGSIESKTGAQPPALRTLELEGDNHAAIDVTGLPACGWADLRSADTAEVRRACGGALVGSGEVELLLAYPGSSPIPVRSELVVLNGGFRGGVTSLFLHARISTPTETTIVAPVKIKKIDDGRYGTRATASIPKFAGGYGLVESFSLKIEKGILTATCFDRRLQTKLGASFADRTILSGTLFQPCTPKG